MNQRVAWTAIVVAVGSSACSGDYGAVDRLPPRSESREAPAATTDDRATTAASAETPTALVFSDLAYPTLLAEDVDSLYWVERGTRTIVSAKKAGGDRRVVVTNVDALELRVDRHLPYLFWIDGAGIVRYAPKSNDQPSDNGRVAQAGTPSGNAVALVVTDATIFFAEYDPIGTSGAVKSMNRGGAVTTMAANVRPTALALGGERLFYFASFGAPSEEGTVFGLKADNTAEHYTGDPLKGAERRRFVLSGDALFMAAGDTLTRMVTVKDAAVVSTKIAGMHVKALATDDAHVWICDSSGFIRRATKDSPTLENEIVARDLSAPSSIVADADGVWFTTEGSAPGTGTVVKIARD